MTCRMRGVLVLSLIGLTGCGALDVTDPTKIEDSELNNPSGALLLYGEALSRLAGGVGYGSQVNGVITDEFMYDTPYFFPPGTSTDEFLDRRDGNGYDRTYGVDNVIGLVETARHAASIAMPKLRAYLPNTTLLGEMFAARGLATLTIAETFCSGFPLNEVDNYKPVYGPPVSTSDGFERVLKEVDSALVYAADSVRVANFAHVIQARALLGLGRFAEAAAAVTSVPTEYVYGLEFDSQSSPNPMTWESVFRGFSVIDREAGTGLDFATAGDPRVQVTSFGTARDGVTPLYRPAKYDSSDAPMVAASGLEARLIEAEAALEAGGDWLGILNQLRATQVTPALPALSDPGTTDSRVDLLFRERAFWLFATGHRLGDLRRLVARYNRTPESVFPTGSYRLGGSYGTLTTVPYVARKFAAYNPAITGCTAQ